MAEGQSLGKRPAVGRNKCHKCKGTGHYCVSMKWKRSSATEQTQHGKQAKRGIKFLENSKTSPGFKEAATVFKGNVL